MKKIESEKLKKVVGGNVGKAGDNDVGMKVNIQCREPGCTEFVDKSGWLIKDNCIVDVRCKAHRYW